MIICQQCTHPNSYDRDTCSQCGTKLMIVTSTRVSSAYGGVDSMLRPTIEEHLLERISELETSLQRAHDRLDMVFDLLQHQAANGLYDHAMLKALVEHLSERGAVENEKLKNIWQETEAGGEKGNDRKKLLSNRLERILRIFGGDNLDLFACLLDTGAGLFAEGNMKRGIRYFEKALLLDPSNAQLAFLIGEHFFRFNKPTTAQIYLERVIDREPENYLALLMLGVICGDEGDLNAAKIHLSRALKIEKNSFTAHYGLGRIMVSEGNLRDAIRHLKRALQLKPTPEMYYLVGRAYLEYGRAEIAARHLRRCIELDPRFDAALYHLGLIYLREENLVLAQEHFRAAYEINPRESRYRLALRARNPGRLAPLPVFGRAAVSSRKVVTSGDVRFAELLRSDLLDSQAVIEAKKRG
ncbi:MAG TPA: tetratricopeptide repeat protein [Blastocatellia bacterium]